MEARWPAPGDVCAGQILLTRLITVPTFAGPTTVCVGFLAANSSDWAAAPPDLPYNPLVFPFWSLTQFDACEPVVFDIAEGTYAPTAINITPLNSVEDLAAIAIRIAHREGRHEGATMLQGMLESLYGK